MPKRLAESKLTLREAVAQFEAKAAYLYNSRFRKLLATAETGVAWNSNAETFGATHSMPDLEMLLGFVSVVRFFRMDKDGFSLECMAKFYRDNASPAHQAQFEKIRDSLDEVFSRPLPMTYNNTPRTYGEWFEEKLWGDLTHFNPRKYPLVHQMKSHPLMEQNGDLDFLEALGVFYQHVQRIRALNRIAFPSLFD